ncbi:MAG TPA: ParB/RepB/Spo0J family partition protein [Solirubrobacteraceae bacterium]|nr:ParB/RepB/Spo0J family partition protein [Solirubrobacteraceae bacterium]
MGRGLQAILSASAESPRQADDGGPIEELLELPLELIVANSRQPRRRFDEDALQTLADSLSERGVLQPVLVRPRAGGSYELIAGERRLRAARLAGLDSIPAIVRERADSEVLELALIENMARADLSPIEEAVACAALTEELGLTREQVGRRVGRTRVAVSNLIRLLDLPDEVIELLQKGSITEGHGRALLLADDHRARAKLARSAVAEGWSVRTLEARARESNRSPQRRRIAGVGGEALHPDAAEAAREVEELLSRALGVEVRARPARGGGFRVELLLKGAQEATELAARLLPRVAA